LITGFSAKEAVISTLAVLTDANISQLSAQLHTYFSPISALSFLVFTLIYTPCIAAVATVRQELGGVKAVAFVILYQTCLAWICAYCVYKIGMFFSFS
jgi:ferrous iron transport protein B